ncbi:EscF/YscF/HrpA family type III secretion system needle major subunit [Bradyrhizobium murdochi]|uniref:EscF/YscF/HrpA family type III secretion system needle major subunit n=1 Tax=Bradyrhizobium murdochi TaxID=1038859 RepID=UPI000A02CDC1
MRGEMHFGSITSSIGQSVVQSERNVRERMATMDPDDTMDLIRFQLSMTKHTTLLNLNSTIIKAVHDALNGIIRNIA